MNDIFKPVGQPNTTTRAYLLKLNHPFQITNHGQKSIFYKAPITWNNLSNFQKITENLTLINTNLKYVLFHRISNETNDINSYF